MNVAGYTRHHNASGFRERVAVLIATKNRPGLLSSRCLPSVVAQTERPDLVVVVDDSSPDLRYETRRAVETFARANVRPCFKYLRNERTRGASGAWNTGLHWMAARWPVCRTTVAFIDDDDSWEPDHLALATGPIRAGAADVVATGMLRIDGPGEPGLRQLPPETLKPTDFLVGNPHIQASNLVARLDLLLDAGGFDEALPSCTDRDLCIRLADLGRARYLAVPQVTVRHHAEGGRTRLSLPGSRAKTAGLDGFWRKYRDRMAPSERERFIERGERLFAWQPPVEPGRHASADEGIWLVVGVIADAARPSVVEPLLQDLRALGGQPAIAGLDVIVLENGPLPPEGKPNLRAAIEAERQRGLRLWLVEIERQAEDAKAGAFGEPFDRGASRLGIAPARSMLQAYLYALARRRPGSIVWILDDDKRLGNWKTRGGSRRLADALVGLRQAGVDIALGTDAGAAPLPMLAILRGELHDLCANLHMLAGLRPNEAVPDRSAENHAVWCSHPAPYHDLAREGSHQETPLWWVPPHGGCNAIDALRAISEEIAGLVNGQPVFRRLPNRMENDLVRGAVPSTRRGGCTFVLDIEYLAKAPNVAAEFGGDPSRRSDMIWATLVSLHFGGNVVEVPLAVEHDRSQPLAADPWTEMLRDVRGHALHRAVWNLLHSRTKRDDLPPLEFSQRELHCFQVDFKRYLKERSHALLRSVERVRGLLDSCERVLTGQSSGPRPWWLDVEPVQPALRRLGDVLSELRVLVSEDRVRAWHTDVRTTSTQDALDFVTGLRSRLAAWTSALARRDKLLETLEAEREKVARSGVASVLGRRVALRTLGVGREGVVLTDGMTVYKWFDAWPLRQRRTVREFVPRLAGALKTARALPRLERFIKKRGHTIACYPYEASEPYTGGMGPGLIALLRECRRYGLVCNNLHPSNLRVAGDRVLLVDIGADVVPMTQEGWTAMCRRAWLCWRWWFRSDLNQLMTRSLRDPALPELTGIDGLLNIFAGPEANTALASHLMEEIGGQGPVLDYGCGKGELARKLWESRVEVVGFDPDPELVHRWARLEQEGVAVRFGGIDLLEGLLHSGTRFPVVVCSLVLCTLEDGESYEEVLSNLRRLVADDGTVLVAVCDPFATFGGSTPYKHRPRMEKNEYNDVFVWEGTSGLTGRTRRDVHRPQRVLERDLRRHGFVVVSRWRSRTTDLHRFEPASDFLVLRLRPVCPQPAVTLAIKTCVMDWRTLEEQVHHIVGQLEDPETFVERVLVVDTRRDGFSRQHDLSDEQAFECAVERLVRQRYVDRVLRCPDDQRIWEELNQRWFGHREPASHAADGSPIAATLNLFESVTTPYLLQVDSDLMICRTPGREPYLSVMLDALEADPRALTVSLPIVQTEHQGPTAGDARGPWRVEVRGALLHMGRLRELAPLPNRPANGVMERSWYRAADEAVRAGRGRSLRIALPSLGFVHPPNSMKIRRDEWMTVLDRCAAGWVPREQVGHVDWCIPVERWLGPPRAERFVVIIQGRDVPPGRIRRCIESLLRQRCREWGAVVMDDGSSSLTAEFLRTAIPHRDPRWTLIRTPIRRGGMANLVWAVRHVCIDPDSIIVLLDLDDAFIGDRVLDIVGAAYDAGADLTVGSMLRTDKEARYDVRFDGARRTRGGGNVWQHLRTFRKRLFDAVPDEALRLNGQYVPVAQDWAYMLAMVELAEHPVWLHDVLYLYEPFGEGKREMREWREEVIAGIVAKEPLSAT